MSNFNKTYMEHFDSAGYAKEYLTETEYELQWIPEEFYHELFSTGKLQGKTMLDVGSGPTVRAAISASGYVPEIYLSDLVESNRELVKKWLRKETDCFDFTAQFKHGAKLEQKDNIQYLEDRVRKAVKDVLSCDILADNPLHPHPMQQFDIVTSSYCVEVFTDDKDYFNAVKNIAKLIRPGGHLAILGALECTTYVVGDRHFPSHFHDVTIIKKSIEEANLEILEMKEHKYKAAITLDTDNKGVSTVFAYKPIL